MYKKTLSSIEQKKICELFDNATPAERSKLSFVQIDLGELGIYRAELSKEARRQFAVDIISCLATKGHKNKNTIGGNYAYTVLAKSFSLMKRKSEGGKNKKNSNKDNGDNENGK